MYCSLDVFLMKVFFELKFRACLAIKYDVSLSQGTGTNTCLVMEAVPLHQLNCGSAVPSLPSHYLLVVIYKTVAVIDISCSDVVVENMWKDTSGKPA
jgi:hypothetical protein